MGRIGKRSLRFWTTTKALALAVGILFAYHGKAAADSCIDIIPESGYLLPGDITAPDPAERLAIMDVISLFFWARDGNASGLTDLFTDGIVYELCTDGGNQQVALRSGPDEADAYLGDLTAYLNLLALQTTHIASNTVLHMEDANTVMGKTAVLVLLQPAYSELPVLDYTATLKSQFEKGDDSQWRFSRMTIIGNTSIPGESGVRGR
jgi:hypothetical protein